jgi:putative acetyltransferase
MSDIEIAEFDPAQADQLGRIFFDAVRKGATDFYDEAQRLAWMPRVPSGPNWETRLASQTTLVACIAGQPVGFMTLDAEGYIDLAFVSPDHHRQGIGQRLYVQIETLARAAGTPRLHSQASFLVRGLFEKKGWNVVRKQRIEKAGVTLTNFLMEKHL